MSIQVDPRLRLIEELLARPIAFHRIFARLCNSVNAGLMLSQARYWERTLEPERHGWFYKSRDEWTEETFLSRYEQEGARRVLRTFDFWDEEKRGVPRRLWFRLDIPKLHQAILQLAENQPTGRRIASQPASGKSPTKGAGKQPAISESTSETTSESSSKKKNDDDGVSLPDFSDREEQLKDVAGQELVRRYPQDAGFIEIALERIHDRSKQAPATVEYFLASFDRLLQNPADVKIIEKRLERRRKVLGIEAHADLTLTAEGEDQRRHFNAVAAELQEKSVEP